MTSPEPITSVILKLANSCNINCSYCYWFKDKSVYDKSKLIRDDVLLAFYLKLRTHLHLYKLTSFTIILHGGEPLLVGKERMDAILFELYKIQIELEVKIFFVIQTNGILIDNEWIDLFCTYDVNIGVSMDGPKDVHDQFRKDLRGKPTYEKTLAGIKLLQKRNMKFGVLAVCYPELSAEKTCNFFIDELGIKYLDILIPNTNYESAEIPYIKEFYKELFQLWFQKYSKKDVKIKIAKNIKSGISGENFKMQSIGYSSEESFMIKPDGEMESSDSLHEIGNRFTSSKLNILHNDINDIQTDDLWKEVYFSSLNLNSKCESCKFKIACGGGHICTRWSNTDRFNNPSVYCNQLYEILEYASEVTSLAKSKSLAVKMI